MQQAVEGVAVVVARGTDRPQPFLERRRRQRPLVGDVEEVTVGEGAGGGL